MGATSLLKVMILPPGLSCASALRPPIEIRQTIHRRSGINRTMMVRFILLRKR
jgi:hypothetical protein